LLLFVNQTIDDWPECLKITIFYRPVKLFATAERFFVNLDATNVVILASETDILFSKEDFLCLLYLSYTGTKIIIP